MKILVLQLARFGDIFITWPSLRALRRKFPNAEIHCVVRKRFAAAIQGCEVVDRVWELDTASILEPLILRSGDADVSLATISEWLELLGEEDFDEIINLSFSPFSSYLTYLLSTGNVQVRGYTRHADGYLAIPDDSSAYFYAQVGIGKYNRFHLGEVFAAVADVELSPDDWQAPVNWNPSDRLHQLKIRQPELQTDYVVVHIGASQDSKALPPYKWHGVILGLLRKGNVHVVMIGSESEMELSREALAAGGCESVINLVGRTNFADSLALIQGARLLIGGDSAPMHLAGFTTTPCLNISFASVNFWETGPRSQNSRILFSEGPATMASATILEEALAALAGNFTNNPIVLRNQSLPVGYEWRGREDKHFPWAMIQAVYSGGEWPVVAESLVAAGLYRLREAVGLAIEQIPLLCKPEARKVANELLGQADVAIRGIQNIVPELTPIVAWFQTERLRLGPMELDQLIEKTEHIYSQLQAILTMYLGEEKPEQEIHP